MALCDGHGTGAGVPRDVLAKWRRSGDRGLSWLARWRVGLHRELVRRLRRVGSKWFPEPSDVSFIPIKDFPCDAHIKLLELQRRSAQLLAKRRRNPRRSDI
jgi:hypothetical protein